MTDLNRLRATLRLHLAEGVGAKTFHRLVEHFGDVVAAADAPPGALRRVSGVGPKTVAAIAGVTEDLIDAELETVERCGARILGLDDEAYPPALQQIHDPPAVLYVRGALEPADAVAVGIVGSRRCTHYGLEQARRFGELLARAGFTVISGGARGIDAAAHLGALEAGGRTIAVMGCGLSQTYPRENRDLFERIVREDRGALLSELPMNTAVLAGNFPTRNRIISGMSLGVLVVEAARRSGSLITAREALEQNREVFAVPGRVDSPMSQGVNELIRRGSAGLVQNLDDILEALGAVGETLSPEPPPDDALPPGLDDRETALYEALREREMGLDELVRRTEIAAAAAASAMTMLVLKGAVEQRPGNVFARKKHTAGRRSASRSCSSHGDAVSD